VLRSQLGWEILLLGVQKSQSANLIGGKGPSLGGRNSIKGAAISRSPLPFSLVRTVSITTPWDSLRVPVRAPRASRSGCFGHLT
jgi:hypothetical protein